MIVIIIASGLGCILLLQRGYERRLKTTSTEKMLGVHQVNVVILAQRIEVAFETCLTTVSTLTWARSIRSDKESAVIRFKTAMTMRSFGETVFISMSETDEQTTKVIVSSKPIVSTTIFDYAKNAENMRLVTKAIEESSKLIS